MNFVYHLCALVRITRIRIYIYEVRKTIIECKKCTHMFLYHAEFSTECQAIITKIHNELWGSIQLLHDIKYLRRYEHFL